MELYDLTAHELHVRLTKKEVSAEEITRAVLDRVDAVEGLVRSYVTQTREQAIRQAKRTDERIRAGESIAPLSGIPAGIKDVISTAGVETTAASKILAGYVPPTNATVIDRLETSGLVMLGKTNCDEFAMGLTTENSVFGATHNPWDLTRVPGGSSGGSAAAVAAGEAVYSLGTDTGGSIRVPAAYCGLVGLKPTYGRVSRSGLIALADSLDHVGPITKDVRDCAMVLGAIAGYDDLDATTSDEAVPDYGQALVSDVRGMKIGVPQEYFGEGLEPAVRQAVMDSINRLAELGAEVIEVSLPHVPYGPNAYTVIQAAEAYSNLGRYDGLRHGYRAPGAKDVLAMYRQTRGGGFGEEAKRRVLFGVHILSHGNFQRYYQKAMQIRTLIIRDFERTFEQVDLLAAPAVPTTALPLGVKPNNPSQVHLARICTVPANLAGLPALSMPCGYAEGLPIGLQLIGKPLGEAKLLQAAYTLEQSSGYHLRRPPLAGRRASDV